MQILEGKQTFQAVNPKTMEPLPTLFDPSGLQDRGAQVANRILVAPSETDDRSVLEAILDTAKRGETAVLATHLIDDNFVQAALLGDADEALRSRAALIDGYVTEFVNSRAEWGMPDDS